jgi:hypothetical protein
VAGRVAASLFIVSVGPLLLWKHVSRVTVRDLQLLGVRVIGYDVVMSRQGSS